MNESNGTNGTGMKALTGASILLSLILGVVALNAPMRAENEIQRQAMLEMRGDVKMLLMTLHEDGQKDAYQQGQVDEKLHALEARAAANSEAIVSQDVATQREMRDLDAIADAKLEGFRSAVNAMLSGIDEKFQNEIGTVAKLLEGTIDNMKSQLEKNDEFQVSNREKIAGMQERLKVIERERTK